MKIPEQKTIYLIAWRKFLVAVLLPRHFLFYNLSSVHHPVSSVSLTLFQQLVQHSVPFWLSTIILIKCFDLYPLLKINPAEKKLTNVGSSQDDHKIWNLYFTCQNIFRFSKGSTPFQYNALRRHTQQEENIYGADFLATVFIITVQHETLFYSGIPAQFIDQRIVLA